MPTAPEPDWRDIVARVQIAIDEAHPPGEERTYLVAELAGHVDRATTAWPLAIDYAAGEVDRRGDLLSGPLYTSARYPWPRNKERWCEPVLQVDLQRWGVLTGRDLGRGLLQLWEPHTSGLIRMIPPDALSDPLTPVPSCFGNEFHSLLGNDDLQTGRPDWLDRPGRITGFGQPFFDAAPFHLRRNIRIIADPEYDGEAKEPEPFRQQLRAILRDMGDPEPEHRHRALGMCGGNIFVTAEDAFLPPVLLTIESDDRVFATLGSTLCVCVDQAGGEPAYSAHLFWE